MPANKDLIKIDEIYQRRGQRFPGLPGLRVTEFALDRMLAALMLRSDLCVAGGILHGSAYASR